MFSTAQAPIVSFRKAVFPVTASSKTVADIDGSNVEKATRIKRRITGETVRETYMSIPNALRLGEEKSLALVTLPRTFV